MGKKNLPHIKNSIWQWFPTKKYLYFIILWGKVGQLTFGAFLETKIFLRSKGGTLLHQKIFLSPIPLKFHVANSWVIRISNFEFHQNLRQKFFWHRRVFNPLDLDFLKNPKGGPFYVKNFLVSDFNEIQNLKSLWQRNTIYEIWVESEKKNFLT